jgi:hypothetical protein
MLSSRAARPARDNVNVLDIGDAFAKSNLKERTELPTA